LLHVTARNALNDADKATAPPIGALLWTPAETAYVLSVTAHTVLNLHRGGALRGVMVGRHLRFRPADVRNYVDALEPAY
jgi:excisionase family DNA binding protein